jgi:PEP-CTERM motif
MKIVKPAVALAMILGGASVAANTVTFNELANDGYGVAYPSLSIGGFDFSNDCVSLVECFTVWGRDNPFQADAGAAALAVTYGDSRTVIRKVGGLPFDLHSIDFTDAINNGFPLPITFTFISFDGSSSQQTVTLNGAVGLQTLIFDKSRLLSVSWVAGGFGATQFDNVTTDVAAVPEPETYALMLAGLAGIGVVARRRRF